MDWANDDRVTNCTVSSVGKDAKAAVESRVLREADQGARRGAEAVVVAEQAG